MFQEAVKTMKEFTKFTEKIANRASLPAKVNLCEQPVSSYRKRKKSILSLFLVVIYSVQLSICTYIEIFR